MSTLNELLKDLTDLDGIDAAVVVNRDGFMIDGVIRSNALDMEFMAEFISAGIGAPEQMDRAKM